MRILSEFIQEDTKILTIQINKNEEIEVKQWELDTLNVPTFVHLWEDRGIAWFTEKVEEIGNKTIINAYYGSSSYNSKQFSKLLDNLVQDCKSVGIQTLEDIELKELIRREYGEN